MTEIATRGEFDCSAVSVRTYPVEYSLIVNDPDDIVCGRFDHLGLEG